MDAIFEFQQSLAAPVYGFVGSYWPFLLVILVGIVTTLFSPRWRDSNGVVIDMSVDGDRDGGADGGDGGDGGGGDGGGGGD